MHTTITARHVHLTEAMRDHVMTIIGKLEQLARRPVEMAVVFETEGVDQVAALRLHLPRRATLVARGRGADPRTALDRAEAKLRSQMARVSRAARHFHPAREAVAV